MEVYIHIPFCVRKCLYCDFLSFPGCDEELQRKYITGLCNEIELWGKLLSDEQRRVDTVFIGGGTPSVIREEYIEKVLCKLKENFIINKNAEVTIEANPGTVDENKLQAYRDCGINRISFGLQSTDNEELKALGRIHTFEEFAVSYNFARNVGFDNINVDIMSALPNQSLQSYVNSIRKVCDLKPEHISAYSLIVEENTPFYNMDLSLPDEDTEREMYYETKRILSEAGFERYEISNYSRAGYECRHNIGYWTGEDYLGFGLGASSYFNGIRFKNSDSFERYFENHKFYGEKPTNIDEALICDLGYGEIEVNSIEDKMREYMFLGLRLTDGVSKKEFLAKFGKNMDEVFENEIQKNMKLSLLETSKCDKDRICLTQRGLDLANTVMSDFV